MDRRFYKITAWCLCAGLAMNGFAGCGKDNATAETSESGQIASVTTALETEATTAIETSLSETSVATEASEMTQTQETYEAKLQIVVEDVIGVIAAISMALADMKVSILQINSQMRSDDRAIINLKVSCKNIEHLKSIVSRLKQLPDVEDVTRGFS